MVKSLKSRENSYRGKSCHSCQAKLDAKQNGEFKAKLTTGANELAQDAHVERAAQLPRAPRTAPIMRRNRKLNDYLKKKMILTSILYLLPDLMSLRMTLGHRTKCTMGDRNFISSFRPTAQLWALS